VNVEVSKRCASPDPILEKAGDDDSQRSTSFSLSRLRSDPEGSEGRCCARGLYSSHITVRETGRSSM